MAALEPGSATAEDIQSNRTIKARVDGSEQVMAFSRAGRAIVTANSVKATQRRLIHTQKRRQRGRLQRARIDHDSSCAGIFSHNVRD